MLASKTEIPKGVRVYLPPQAALKREIETTEWGAPITGDERGGIEPTAFIGSVLIERQAHQRLDAREEDEPFFLTVLGVQGEITLDRHGASSRGAERMIRAALMRRKSDWARSHLDDRDQALPP